MYDDPERAIKAVDELLGSKLIGENTKRQLINFREELLGEIRRFEQQGTDPRAPETS
jgi:hypothetical protein